MATDQTHRPSPGQENRELKTLADYIPASILIYKKQDGHVRIIDTNIHFQSLPFASETRLMSMDEAGLLDLVHPEDREETRVLFARMFDQCIPGEKRYRSLAGKGTQYRWYHLNGRPVAQPDGSVLAYVVFTDITAEKEAELRALKNQQMYRLAAEQSKQIIWEYDQAHRRVIYQMDNAYTRAICEAFGMPSVVENVPGSLVGMVDEPFREAFLAIFDKIDDGASDTALEYSTTFQGQVHWWRLISTAVTDDSGRVLTIYCSAQDITDMKAEQQRYLDTIQNLEKAYPDNLGTFHLNLTKNLCLDGKSPFPSVLKQKESGTAEGYFDAFSKLIADEDILNWFRRVFTLESLLHRYHHGETTLSFPYPIRYPDGLRWRKGILSLYKNPLTGDIEGITYAIDIDRQRRGEMVLDRMSSEGSDFIGYVDVVSGTFVMHSGNWRCQGLESGQRETYSACLDRLSAYCASPGSARAMCAQASLEKVRAALESDGEYSLLYDFAEKEGPLLKKQVLFQWFNDDKSEILVIQSDITGVWKGEQERLRRAEEANVLKATIANVPVGITVIAIQDGVSTLIAENDYIHRMLGIRFQDGNRFFDHIHPDDKPLCQDAIQRSHDGVHPVSVEFRFRRDWEADYHWFRMMTNCVVQENGDRLVYCCLSDIHEEKTAEAARIQAQQLELQKYEGQIRMLANANPDFTASCHLNLTRNQCTGMVVMDETYAGLKKLMAGGTAEGLFTETAGMIPDEAMAAQFRQLYNRDSLLRQFGEGETQVSMEYPCRSVRGGVRWVSSSIHMMRNPETGDVEGITYALDIDDQKKSRLVTKNIVEQEFEYIGILYLPDGEIELLQKKDHVIFPEIGRKVPYGDRRRFVQQHFTDPGELESFNRSTALERIEAELERTGSCTFSYMQTDRTGRRTCLQVRLSWLDESHRIAMIVQSDVTASYDHEEKQIAAIQNALIEAENANSAKSDFVSRISHDIRTPIGAITNLTAFALEDIHNPEKLVDDLRKIQASNAFLLSLVNDVLDISKIDSGKIELHPEPYTYTDFCANIRNMFEPLCESRHIHFALIDAPAIDAIYLDHVRFNQIAMNLISNAVKYTPEGGSVSVTTEVVRLTDGRLRCALIVSDTGIGMGRAFQKTMFEPFTQEDDNPHRDRTIPGTGLGLSLVKKIVDLMGGSIAVDSAPGRGTRITVSFVTDEAGGPAGPGDQTGAAPADKAEERLSGRVLLAEDNAINMEIAKRVLEKLGLEVVHVENGQAAADAFAASAPGEFQVILMDIQMPVLNGYEATAAIRALDRPDAKAIPIIAMTADAFTAAIEHSRSVGMSDYVTKPLDVTVLREALVKSLK